MFLQKKKIHKIRTWPVAVTKAKVACCTKKIARLPDQVEKYNGETKGWKKLFIGSCVLYRMNEAEKDWTTCLFLRPSHNSAHKTTWSLTNIPALWMCFEPRGLVSLWTANQVLTFDYVRAWHRNLLKVVDPARANPGGAHLFVSVFLFCFCLCFLLGFSCATPTKLRVCENQCARKTTDPLCFLRAFGVLFPSRLV